MLRIFEEPLIETGCCEESENNIPKMSIIEFVYDRNKKHLGKTAFFYMGRKITYDEFFRNVSMTAQAFKKMGVKKGDIVTLMPINTPEFMYAYYGLNMIGAIANSIHPLSSKRDIKNYLKEVDSNFVVCSDANCKELSNVISEFNNNGKNIKGIIAPFSNSVPLGVQLKSVKNKELVKKSKELKKNSKEAISTSNFIIWNDFIRKGKKLNNIVGKYDMNFEGAYDDVALIVHTGGTTGVPKGVKLTNKNGVALAQNHIQTKELTRFIKHDTTILGNISMYTAFGFLDNLNVPLTLGVTIELEPVYSVNTFLRDICEKRPNIIFTVPSFLEEFKLRIEQQELLTGQKVDLSFIDIIIVGGQKLTQSSYDELIEFFSQRQPKKKEKVKIDTGYGSSETSAAATCTIFDGCDKKKVGKPFKSVNIKIIDTDTKEELPVGEIGEIIISGPTVMKGYYKMEEETKKVLFKDSDGKIWYRTGDIGFLDKNGELDVIGRKRKMITMYNGYKIASPSIEDMVEKLDIIKRCVIVPMKDPFHVKGEVPKAYVSLNHVDGYDENKIKEMVKNIVSQNMNERNNIFDVIIVDEIPDTKLGKKDFKAVEIMDLINSMHEGISCTIKNSNDQEYDYVCEIKNLTSIDNDIILNQAIKAVNDKEQMEGIKKDKRKTINYIFSKVSKYSDDLLEIEKCKVPTKKLNV